MENVIKQLVLIFCIFPKTEICPDYISKINLNCEKQIILLMILDEEKEGLWHYLAVKKPAYIIKRDNIMVILIA